MKGFFGKIFASLKLHLGYYAVAASVLGGVWGVFSMYDNWKDSNEKLQANIQTVINAQKQSRTTDSLIIVNQNEINERLNNIESVTNSLRSSYIRYISNDEALTKQDFLEYMDGIMFDLKKNNPSESTAPTQDTTELKIMTKPLYVGEVEFIPIDEHGNPVKIDTIKNER